MINQSVKNKGILLLRLLTEHNHGTIILEDNTEIPVSRNDVQKYIKSIDSGDIEFDSIILKDNCSGYYKNIERSNKHQTAGRINLWKNGQAKIFCDLASEENICLNCNRYERCTPKRFREYEKKLVEAEDSILTGVPKQVNVTEIGMRIQ